jgi:hypothetical protein
MMHILCFLPTYVCGVILLTNYVFLPVGRVSGMSWSRRVLRVNFFVYTSWGALVLSKCIMSNIMLLANLCLRCNIAY